jgi:hypothetical protein
MTLLQNRTALEKSGRNNNELHKYFNPSICMVISRMPQYVVNEALWSLVKPISVVLLSISHKRFLLLKAASVDGDYV